MSDLQSGITILDNGKIIGTLHYVTDYTGFDASHPELQSGNYIAIHVDTIPDATITVKVTNPVTLDEDRTAVLRIADKDSQTITVVASAEGYATTTQIYRLNNLICETEGHG